MPVKKCDTMRRTFRFFLLASLASFMLIIFVAFQVLITAEGEEFDTDYDWEDDEGAGKDAGSVAMPYPIIMWWTPLTGEKGRVKKCGDVKCFFTVDRRYQSHPQTKVYIFYGTDLHHWDLPLPRQPHHEWAVLHEESPKNQYMFSHRELVELFNHTATFKRQSHFPLTLQYLEDVEALETTEYLVSTEEKNKKLSELALVNYVHSDCGPPSDRDRLVQMLQKYIKVDSYGTCLHNKDLPKHLQNPLEGMMAAEFYHLVAQYKFTLAFENGICDDYITEKVWRPWTAGSVPIILGSPKIQDYLPSPKSAILVDDFDSVEDLVNLIRHLNNSDAEYEEYLQFKKTGVTNHRLKQELKDREWDLNDDDRTKPHLIDGFECFVCRRIHENMARVARGQSPLLYHATVDHYGCPEPMRFKDKGGGDDLTRVRDKQWSAEWLDTKYQAMALRESVARGKAFTDNEFYSRAYEIRKKAMRAH